MQLPPTILSINKDRKNKNSAVTPKTGLNDKKKGTKPEPIPKDSEDVLDESGSSGLGSDSSDQDEDISTAKGVAELSLKPQTMKNNTSSVLRPPRTLETTLFERLEEMYGSSIKRMLQVQYRSVHLRCMVVKTLIK